MGFMSKARAQAHYNSAGRLLMNLQIHFSIKDLENAIIHLRKATELDPGFAYAFHNLALSWYNLADYNVAASNIQGGPLLSPHSPDEVEDSISGSLELALQAVDKALAIRPVFPQAHNTRAMILGKLFRLNEAMQAAELAVSQDPDYENARSNRDKIREMIRQRAQVPGFTDENDFLRQVKEAREDQTKVWKDLRG